MHHFDLKNRQAIITGGAQGFGLDIAKKFLKSGAKVRIWDIDQKELKKVINSENNPNLNFDIVDVSDFNNVNRVVKEIIKNSKIDILINNAGINMVSPINEIDEKYLDEIYKVNLRGPIIMTKEISKIMIKKRRGKIINISSIFGTVGKSGRSLYSSTKFGLVGLTKSASLDLAKYNILVNTISPGVINTGLTKKVLNSVEEKRIKKDIPLKKLGKASDVSYLVCFLCSDFNNYITGQNFIIDGGYTSK